jgi:hypothetical protein
MGSARGLRAPAMTVSTVRLSGPATACGVLLAATRLYKCQRSFPL